MTATNKTAAEKIEYLARELTLNKDLITAANLGPERLDTIFNRAVKNENFQKRYVGPAGAVAMGLFVLSLAGTYVPAIKAYEPQLLLAFAPTLMFFLVGDKILNKRDSLRGEVRRAAETELLRVKDNKPAPQP